MVYTRSTSMSRRSAAEYRQSPALALNAMTVRGYAARFGSWSLPMPMPNGRGQFIERIARGAFTPSLANGRDIRALYNHDADGILGRTSNGTLRLSQDDVGLSFELDLPATQLGRDLAVLVERGDVAQCSFAFGSDLQDCWEQDRTGMNQRTLLRIGDLREVTLTSTPAYLSTSVAALRSANPRVQQARALEQARYLLNRSHYNGPKSYRMGIGV